MGKIIYFNAIVAAFGIYCVSAWAVSDLSKCRGDVAKFCSDVPKGGGRITMCLNKNMDSLSEECQASMTGKKILKPAKKQVQEEVQNEESVPQEAASPKSAEPKMLNKKWDEMVQHCEYELNSFCWNVKKGDTTGFSNCLRKNSSNMRDGCKKFTGM